MEEHVLVSNKTRLCNHTRCSHVGSSKRLCKLDLCLFFSKTLHQFMVLTLVCIVHGVFLVTIKKQRIAISKYEVYSNNPRTEDSLISGSSFFIFIRKVDIQ